VRIDTWVVMRYKFGCEPMYTVHDSYDAADGFGRYWVGLDPDQREYQIFEAVKVSGYEDYAEKYSKAVERG
jgi:hypothetical protein